MRGEWSLELTNNRYMEFQGFRQVDPRQLSTSLSPEKMGSKFGEQNTNYCLECARSLDVLFEIKCTVVQ